MTENGGTLFTLGTKSGDTIAQDAEDVLFTQILDHVTPSELARFENADYEAEDEAERIHLENMKPRGRPRKDGAATANGLVPKMPKPKPSGLASGGYSAFRGEGQPKKRGRPVGWRKHGGPAAPGGPVPSFNGPQPTGEVDTEPDMSTREQTEDLAEKRLDIQAKTGVYSMVSASGLGPQVPDSGTEMDTREPTPSPNDEMADEPTPKRRRVDVDASSPSTSFETAPPSPVLQSRATSDEDERLNLLDQHTLNPQQIMPKPRRSNKSEKPKLPDQSTPSAQLNRPSHSSNDDGERLNLLDQLTSNSQQRNTPHHPKTNPPKRHDQSTLKPQQKRPSRSTSDEDERLNLLDQFTAKPNQDPPRSTTASTQDSMLSSIQYTSPTKPHAAPRQQKPPPSLPTLHQNPTITPKRTSMTPHYPGSAGGVLHFPIPISSTDHGSIRRRGPSLTVTSPSRTRHHIKHRTSPSKPATTTPAPPYRSTLSSKPGRPRQPQQQQQRPSATTTNPSNSNATPRPSTRSSSSLNTYQADTVRAMDSYFSPRKHATNMDKNIDPRLRPSQADSNSDSSDDGNEDGSGESFTGVAEPPRPQPAPAPARPVEGRRATAVKVVVVSQGGGKGAGRVVDGKSRDSKARIIGSSSIQPRSHGMAAEQRNGTNANGDTDTVISEDGEESEDEEEDNDDDAGSIEL